MPSDILSLSYVIITSKALADSFLQLRNWKRQKGVRTDIMTVENIEQAYEGKSLQEKIKRCLYDLHTKKGLSYVLLGGDDTVVPVRYCANTCYMPNKSIIPIPTDLYYSCFDKTFDWDYNGNGIYGEPADSVGLMPSIYLTRVPVRTSAEAESFGNRIISYEKMTNATAYNNKMLMCGSKLGRIYDSGSDAELKGDTFYENFIRGIWNGERKKLYDTYNDLGCDKLSNITLQSELAKGYAFADVATHGAPWCYNLNSSLYSTYDAGIQKNSGYTVMTTIACSTNAFDDCDISDEYRDPCLSESLIRNTNSGVIAYLGCSREGWFYNGFDSDKTLGVSYQYESRFYGNLFSKKVLP